MTDETCLKRLVLPSLIHYRLRPNHRLLPDRRRRADGGVKMATISRAVGGG
jgi:hypothetical protein